MKTDSRCRAVACSGTIVLGLLVAMVAAAGETDCTNCSEDPRFPEATALLEDAGYSSAEYTVLFAWQEVAPKSAGVIVTGYRVRHDIGGAVFDLYTDAAGALLNAAALNQLGVRPKNWELRPLATEPEPVRGGLKRSVRPLTPRGVKDLDNAAVARVALGAVDAARLIDEDKTGELGIPKGVLRTGDRKSVV